MAGESVPEPREASSENQQIKNAMLDEVRDGFLPFASDEVAVTPSQIR
jgi:hypothetical protein